LRRNEDGSLAEITENEQQQAADALQSQAERIKELEAEAEQLRKGHFDTSEANAALRSKLKKDLLTLPRVEQGSVPE
jgi:seryl-tRNA synthetase